MALEFNRTTFLKVYTGEVVLYDDIPLVQTLRIQYPYLNHSQDKLDNNLDS